MPLYEFLCEECGESFEVKLSLEEYEKTKPSCPKCKSQKVKRIITSIYVHTESKT